MKNNPTDFLEQQLLSAGITTEQNTVRFKKHGTGEEIEGKVLDVDANGNVRILYLDPYGNQCTYQTPSGATRPFYQTRNKVSKGSKKYHIPTGAEAYPFLPPPLIEKVKAGVRIHTLFITEGAKKAFAATLRGMDCMGLSGIYQYKAKGTKELHPFILEVIRVCQVEELVFVVDSDCLNITSNDALLTVERLVESDLTKRPSNFYNAAKGFAEVGRSTGVNLYFGYIKPENRVKGLDDLLVGLATEEEEIIADARLLTKATSYFTIVSLNETSYFKLANLFGIIHVATFYSIHARQLKEYDFNFKGQIYRYDADAEEPVLSEHNYLCFWRVSEKGEITIDLVLFLEFLHQSGFRLYRLGVDEFLYVRVQENVLKLISKKDIKDYATNYVQGLAVLPEPRRHTIINQLLLFPRLFTDERLNALQVVPEQFHTDKADCMYFYFRNGFVEVSPENITIRPYSELTGYIWEKQILPHDFTTANSQTLREFMFTRFVQNVCSVQNGAAWVPDPERFDAFASVIGYALHRKKQERKAIVFTDMVVSDEPEGRTGKTMIGKALAKLRVSAEVDGKNFNPDDKFKYQSAEVDTQILHINDAGRGKKPFDFELMFTAITEGVVVEKKNQATFTIHPTILISSNRALEIIGGSARARVVEFEFANYYSDKFSPKDEFDAWFFDDWNAQDWNLFYFFMFNCARSFLANGVIQPNHVNLDERKLRQASSPEFFQFAKEHLQTNAPFAKSELLKRFKDEFTDYEKLTSQKFTKWLEAYGRFKGWKLEDAKKVDGIRYYQYKE